jgi:hypothetical protein
MPVTTHVRRLAKVGYPEPEGCHEAHVASASGATAPRAAWSSGLRQRRAASLNQVR